MRRFIPAYAPGHTLVEFLIYIGLVSLFLVFVMDMVFSLITAKHKQNAILEVGRNGQIALERMEIAVRNATGITQPASGATSTSLILTLPSASSSPLIFSLSGGVLHIKEGSSATSTITADEVAISDLTFTNVAGTGVPAGVRIQMTVSAFGYNLNFGSTALVRQRP